jgi:hypothetical protein
MNDSYKRGVTQCLSLTLPFCPLPFEDTARRPSLDAGALILDFRASRTVRKFISALYKLPNSKCSVIIAQMD